jgi:MOSC domain-containing protein YiiM
MTSDADRTPSTWRGRLHSIHTTATAGEPLQSRPEVEARRGRGLVGDRYFLASGTFSKPGMDSEVTLIESETLAALGSESDIHFAAGDSRRNLVTQGVPLNHLVGRDFFVGEVLLRGVRLCEPCGHLEKLTVSGVRDALRHRGGLRAAIITGGTLRAGDPILPAEAQ